jgi:hypothetical protein
VSPTSGDAHAQQQALLKEDQVAGRPPQAQAHVLQEAGHLQAVAVDGEGQHGLAIDQHTARCKAQAQHGQRLLLGAFDDGTEQQDLRAAD